MSWGLHDGIGALIKRDQKAVLTYFCHKIQQKSSSLHLEKKFFTKPDHDVILTLNSSASKPMRNKSLLFMSHNLWFFNIAVKTNQDTLLAIKSSKELPVLIVSTSCSSIPSELSLVIICRHYSLNIIILKVT